MVEVVFANIGEEQWDTSKWNKRYLIGIKVLECTVEMLELQKIAKQF